MSIETWKKLSLAEQLGNIGSEFHRWQNTKSEKSFEETLNLLDMTIKNQSKSGTLAELTRLREVICDLATGSKFYQITSSNLDNYFLGFALLARK